MYMFNSLKIPPESVLLSYAIHTLVMGIVRDSLASLSLSLGVSSRFLGVCFHSPHAPHLSSLLLMFLHSLLCA